MFQYVSAVSQTEDTNYFHLKSLKRFFFNGLFSSPLLEDHFERPFAFCRDVLLDRRKSDVLHDRRTSDVLHDRRTSDVLHDRWTSDVLLDCLRSDVLPPESRQRSPGPDFQTSSGESAFDPVS
jgi:hypothetical protein